MEKKLTNSGPFRESVDKHSIYAMHIATIGSEENHQWSRACHNISRDCREACGFDENTVHWKRAKLAKNTKKKN
jgi:hypothetical protein